MDIRKAVQRIVFLGMMLLICRMATAQSDVRDVSGTWRFQLDPRDQGIEAQWSHRDLDQAIELPGILTAQGYGDSVSMDTAWTGNIREEWFKDPYYRQYQDPCDFIMPFWLQPDRHYVGAAWYQRDIDIPEAWDGKRVVLFLERPHWETSVWLDGQPVGHQRSLGTPHEYVLGCGLAPGRHRLTVRVDNRMIVNVGPNSHSVSDHTQGNWNGIVGRLELRATDPVWIEELRAFPSVTGELRVTANLGNLTGGLLHDVTLTVKRTVGGEQTRQQVFRWEGREAARGAYACTVPIDGPRWDEFTPTLHALQVMVAAVVDGQTYADQRSVTFGLRDVGTRGSRITINNKPVFLRGTLECCIFPKTGYPPMDVAEWKRIIRVCQDHGLNHMRFHSWCPPEAAFAAADELGFYLQVECSSWANQGTAVGDGQPVDDWLYEEAAAILKAYGNHPSFIMMAYGNEPGGPQQVDYLTKFVEHWQREDPRRLYTSGAGWPLIPESEFHVAPQPRIQAWGQGLKSIINAEPPRTDYDWSAFVQRYPETPVVSHEIGQWCVYPNLAERAKYTGPLKARNFDVFAVQLERHGMRHQARDFLLASGKLQTLCYKADIEAALRTPGFGGFQLLDLHDFPGQGTALVGVLDPFWDEKGYVTAAQYRSFSGPIVPLARLARRVFEVGDRLQASVQLSHFGAQDLQGVTPAWTLRDPQGEIVKSGAFKRQDIARGSLTEIGTVQTDLTGFDRATRLRLEVILPETDVVNTWDLWVYPKRGLVPSNDTILITRTLDDKTDRHLKQGGKVLWLPPSQSLADDEKYPLKMGFSSIFWNTVWTGRQAPHTLGILCDPKHPALAAFPTEFHSNWQWWDLMHDGRPFILTDFRNLQPVVQVIDDWVTARKLGLVFEARVGAGKLLACSSDLVTDLEQRPVARQLRSSLLRYMNTDSFAPTAVMAATQLQSLLRQPSLLERLGATATADNHQLNYEAQQALDGDARTLWHTAWQPMAAYPHHLVLDLKKPQRILGLTYLPRADQSNGRIADYEVYGSRDGTNWGEPLATGTWPDTPTEKTVRFETVQQVRYVKLKALSEVKGQAFASAAEIDVLVE